MTYSRSLAVFLFAALVGISLTARAANNCSAKSLLGGSCNTECGPGWHGECSGGIFSSECRCVKDDQTSNTIRRSIPDLTPKQMQDSKLFEDWARSTGSAGLTDLANLDAQVRTAVLAHNEIAYGAGERQFWLTWQSLSSGDQAAIAQWQIANGYQN